MSSKRWKIQAARAREQRMGTAPSQKRASKRTTKFQIIPDSTIHTPLQRELFKSPNLIIQNCSLRFRQEL